MGLLSVGLPLTIPFPYLLMHWHRFESTSILECYPDSFPRMSMNVLFLENGASMSSQRVSPNALAIVISRMLEFDQNTYVGGRVAI